MKQLIDIASDISSNHDRLPFSLYTSVQEQHLINVPIIKPLFIAVLDGTKNLGLQEQMSCSAGQFIFLANSPKVEMRNVPSDRRYCALLIEFEYTDFDSLVLPHAHKNPDPKATYLHGPLEGVLEKTLIQFVEWSAYAPQEMWPLRRKEIIQALLVSGYSQVQALAEAPSLTHRVHDVVRQHLSEDIGLDDICAQLAMSESTLRRKLQAEGSQWQDIKDGTRLGYGLHLLQTTHQPIGLIAEQCGYASQSRFTDRFKTLFGMTPTDIRKTRLTDSGQ